MTSVLSVSLCLQAAKCDRICKFLPASVCMLQLLHSAKTGFEITHMFVPEAEHWLYMFGQCSASALRSASVVLQFSTKLYFPPFFYFQQIHYGLQIFHSNVDCASHKQTACRLTYATSLQVPP